MKAAKAIGVIVLLFVGVYAPAFLTVSLLKLSPLQAVPVVIVISFIVAVVLIGVMARGERRFTGFGFRSCAYRYIGVAIAIGVPAAWALAILVSRFTSGQGPFGPSMRWWMTAGYFVIGAAIQEEVIFRGLLQTALGREFPGTLELFGVSISYAALFIAVLFGLIHFSVNPVTAGAAFVLGLIAGELRHRSRSLLPAILVHSIFNVFGMWQR